MKRNDYGKSSTHHCMLVKNLFEDDFNILLLYVDDMLIFCHETNTIQNLKKKLSNSFTMKDLSPLHEIFGKRIFRDRKKVKLWFSQHNYT